MKKVIGMTLIITGVLGGLYVGLLLMFICPIIEVCNVIDAGALTASILGVAVLKCVMEGPVGAGIAFIGIILGAVLLD